MPGVEEVVFFSQKASHVSRIESFQGAGVDAHVGSHGHHVGHDDVGLLGGPVQCGAFGVKDFHFLFPEAGVHLAVEIVYFRRHLVDVLQHVVCIGGTEGDVFSLVGQEDYEMAGAGEAGSGTPAVGHHFLPDFSVLDDQNFPGLHAKGGGRQTGRFQQGLKVLIGNDFFRIKFLRGIAVLHGFQKDLPVIMGLGCIFGGNRNGFVIHDWLLYIYKYL